MSADDDSTEVLPAMNGATQPGSTPPGATPPGATQPGSTPPGATQPSAPKGGGFRWGLLTMVLVLLVLAGGYYAAAAYTAERVPAGTSVLGVDIGGLTEPEARAALDGAAEEANTAPLAVTAGEAEISLDPATAGLAVDAGATVDSLIGFTLDPYDIWRGFSGADAQVEPVVAVERDALTAALDDAADSLRVEPVDAQVALDGTHAAVTAAVDGSALDVDATADTIVAAWPTDGVDAAMTVEAAALTTAAAQEYAQELDTTLLAGDVTLTGPRGDVVLTPADLAGYAEVRDEGASFDVAVNGERLARDLAARTPELESESTEPSIAFDSSHRIDLANSSPGSSSTSLDGSALGETVLAAVADPERAGELPYADPEEGEGDLAIDLDELSEVVSSFTTPLPYDPTRTKNLARAGELITGVVIRPGERFDLTEVLAPINAANGYFEAGILVNGIHTTGFGGGLSQVATTTYNAGYFAGMEDIEHRPHSVWFERYPAGRESTMFIGSINMVFENSTPYALVMSAYVDGGTEFTVDIWSTPHFTVKTYASDKRNVTQPTTVDVSDSRCEPSTPGQAGFTITNTREVYLGDELVDTTDFTWTYRPDNGVNCV
ncbi:VanW family protein [Demequina pelophila]|uniref:VanW family protein n=1 Tax=Demequina pelophila TaxID=1638984 RepID=UPI0007814F87|nr:VanW family protein [Demequina pelophila]